MKKDENDLFDYERAEVDVRLGNLEGNTRALKEFSSPAGLLAVVKANAYGHGAEEVCRVLEPYVRGFGVSDISEAVALRRSGVGKPILVFGRTHESSARLLCEFGITQTVFSEEYAKSLSLACPTGGRISVHIKTDTGMSRFGMGIEDAFVAVGRILRLKNLSVEGIYTHLAASDGRDLFDKAYTRRQIERFSELLARLENKGIVFPYRHCCASGGIPVNAPEFNLVRAGLALYGCEPYKGYPVPLREVMTLKSRIVSVKRLKKGSFIGYGCSEALEKDSFILVAAIGYADGYPRSLSGKGKVFVRGKPLRVIGRVCMDLLMLDGEDGEFEVGDEVGIFGFGTPVGISDFASSCGTIPYEVLCRISPRVPRRYIR